MLCSISKIIRPRPLPANTSRVYLHLVYECRFAERCINTHTQRCKSYMTMQTLWKTLTLLPSLCQNTAGCGFPLASHGKVAVRPCITIWSRGLTTNWGASEEKGQMGIIANTQTQVVTFSQKQAHRCGHVLCKSRGVGKRALQINMQQTLV